MTHPAHSDEAGLYVHIPFCRGKCRYCVFYSEDIASHDQQRLVNCLINQAEYYAAKTNFNTVYIGGGTPGCLESDILIKLVSRLRSTASSAAEFTVECNPGDLDESLADRLAGAGIDRISIGAQSFVQEELDFLGRRHTVADTERAVSIAKRAGLKNISLDLIFAIPGTDEKRFSHSLESAIALDPKHISAYSLSYENGSVLYDELQSGKITPVDQQTDAAQYQLAIEKLISAGFDHYEISNFAMPGFQCKHNLIYWANDQYIGLGPGGSSYFNGTRSKNVEDINAYVRAVEQGQKFIVESSQLSPIETACETAVLNLRRQSGINLDEFKQRTGYSAEQLFAEAIEQNKKFGLIERCDNHLRLTKKALPIADTVLCDFADV